MRAGLVPVLCTLGVLGGCAVMDPRWDACEKGAPTFVAMAECTVRAVQEDAQRSNLPTLRVRSEARAQRFTQIAEDLSEKVGTGRMPEADARVALKRVLDELLDAERDDRLSPIRQQPKTMTCSPTGPAGGVICSPN